MDLTSHLGEDNQAPLKKAQVNNNIKTEDINPDNKQDKKPQESKAEADEKKPEGE